MLPLKNEVSPLMPQKVTRADVSLLYENYCMCHLYKETFVFAKGVDPLNEAQTQEKAISIFALCVFSLATVVPLHALEMSVDCNLQFHLFVPLNSTHWPFK